MTTTPDLRTRKASTEPSVRISRTLMQDYRTESPATDVADVALAWLNDELMIFTVDSQRVLHRLHRDPSSSSGWSSQALHDKISSVTVWKQDGADRVFCQGDGLYEITRTASGQYKAEYLAIALGGNISVSSCDEHPILCTSVPEEEGQTFWPPVGGYCTAADSLFILVGDADTHADKAACIDLQGNAWPRLPFILFKDKTLRSCHGTGFKAPDSSLDYKQIHVSFDALPALAGVRDFVTLRDDEGNPQIIAVDGGARLYVITGAVDAATPGKIDWPAGWNSLFLTGECTPTFTKVQAINVDGRVDVVLYDAATSDLWISGCVDGAWTAAIDLGVPGEFVAVNLNTAGAVEFAASGGERLTLVSRDRAADWRSEDVFLPSAEKIEMLLTYRSSLNLVGDFNSVVTGDGVNVFASDETVAAVGLSHQVLRPDDAIAAKSDAFGRVTITSEVRDTLYAPAVAFQGGFSGNGYIEVHPDADVQAFLKDVTAAQLLAGRDPLTNSEILPGAFHTQEDAEAIAATLAKIGDFIDHEYAPESATNAPFRFAPARGVRFVEGPYSQSRTFRPKPAAAPWHFSVRDGRARFRTLTPAESAGEFAAARVLETERFRIDLGSLLRSAAKGLAEISDVIVDGVDAAIKFTLNGVGHALTFVIDSLERAFDAVSTVFDMVGIDLDVVVGWLAAVIGFLFDWSAIKAARDRVKQSVRDNAAQVTTLTADPMSLLPSYTSTLQTLPSAIDGIIAQLRAAPIGSNSFETLVGPLPPLPDLTSLFASGAVLFEPVMWLAEKGLAALSNLTGNFGLPNISGFADTIAALSAKIQEAAAAIMSLMNDFWQNELLSWITSLATFEAGTIVDILEFVQRAVQSVVDLLTSLVEGMLQLVHLAWASPLQVVAWLDTPITVPFLSTFYREVLGNDFSLLDLACLGLGLMSVFLGHDDTRTMVTDMLMTALIFWTATLLGTEALSMPLPGGMPDGPRMLASVVQAIVGVALTVLADPNWAQIGPVVLGSGILNLVLASGDVSVLFEAPLISGVMCILLSMLDRPGGVATLPSVVVGLFLSSNVFSSAIRLVPPDDRVRIANPYLALQGVLAVSIDAVCAVAWHSSEKGRSPARFSGLGPAPA